MSFEFDISEKDKASAEFMSCVHGALMREVVSAAKERGISRAAIARALDIDRSAVSRALNGTANLTIRTVSDLCWAIGVEPHFEACEPETREGCNHRTHGRRRSFEYSVRPLVIKSGSTEAKSMNTRSKKSKIVEDRYVG